MRRDRTKWKNETVKETRRPNGEIHRGAALIGAVSLGKDWCHFCGARSEGIFAVVASYENAEHAVLSPRKAQQTRNHRICARCVECMSDAVKEAETGPKEDE